MIFILVFVIYICKGQSKSNFDIINIETSRGKIIYEGISNEIFYNTTSQNELINLKFKAKENCSIIDHGGYIGLTANEKSKYVIINVSINDTITQDFIFFVQKLPLPQILFDLDSEIEKQNLPTEIEKTNLKNLKSIQAMVEIGRLSWVSYEIKSYEIIILSNNNKQRKLKNNGQNMSEENFKHLITLKKDDIICFINITCVDNGKQFTFNERSIKIK